MRWKRRFDVLVVIPFEARNCKDCPKSETETCEKKGEFFSLKTLKRIQMN